MYDCALFAMETFVAYTRGYVEHTVHIYMEISTVLSVMLLMFCCVLCSLFRECHSIYIFGLIPHSSKCSLHPCDPLMRISSGGTSQFHRNNRQFYLESTSSPSLDTCIPSSRPRNTLGRCLLQCLPILLMNGADRWAMVV